MYIHVKLKELIKDILVKISNSDLVDYEKFSIETPKDKSHGEVSTNVAMVYVKDFKTNPRKLAEQIVSNLKESDIIEDATIAGPGFINMRLAKSIWYQEIENILEQKASYGDSNAGKGKKISFEYVSTNPTGPIHIGHTRNAIFGDVLANLLIKTGHDVTKEYYINDRGEQIKTLAKSLFLRYKEQNGIDIGEIPEGLYPGDYLIEAAKNIANKFGDKFLNIAEELALEEMKEIAVSEMMTIIKDDLKLLKIEHDLFVSEKKLFEDGLMDKAIEEIKDKNLTYIGHVDEEDSSNEPKLIFKSTQFGDDKDRVIKKSNGDLTYFAGDFGYSYARIERGFNNLIVVLGADHSGYVKRFKSMVTALSDDKAKIEPKLVQMVNYVKNGEQLKMSKRAGSYVTAKDIVEMVGVDILRFIMMTRSQDMILDFDVEKVKEQSKDNPVFYVQYAAARANSVIENGEKEISLKISDIIADKKYDLTYLKKDEELNLVKIIANFPKVVEQAAKLSEPHRISYYLIDLASEFHNFWNRGKEDNSLKFIISDNKELTVARLALVQAILFTISAGLKILGIDAVRNM